MDKNTIYHKSLKGAEELSSRTYKLPARERSVLIMVDGKSTAQEVIDKARHFGEAEHFFQTLIENGFIEAPAAAVPVPGPAPVATPIPAPQAPAPASTQELAVRSMSSAIDYACLFLAKVVGPDADMMTGKIESCKTADELRAVVEKYREIVRSVAGSRRAEEFVGGVSVRLPQGLFSFVLSDKQMRTGPRPGSELPGFSPSRRTASGRG